MSFAFHARNIGCTLAVISAISLAAACSSNDTSDAQTTSSGAGGRTAGAGGGATGSGGSGGAEAAGGVHLVHAALGLGPAELCVDGASVGQSTAPGAASPRVALGPGTYTVRAATPGTQCADALAPDLKVTLTEQKPFSLALLFGAPGSSSAPPKLKAFEVVEDYLPTYSASRFVNAAPGFGDLEIGDESSGTYQTLFANAPYGSEGLVVPVGLPGYVDDAPVNGQVLAVRKANEMTDLVVANGIVREAEKHYSLIAAAADDTATAPPAVLLCQDYPDPSCAIVTP